jgi:hypothetical protein
MRYGSLADEIKRFFGLPATAYGLMLAYIDPEPPIQCRPA